MQNADLNDTRPLYICHADELRNAEELAAKVKEANPNCQIKIRLLSPIIGAHLGPGAVVLGYIK